MEVDAEVDDALQKLGEFIRQRFEIGADDPEFCNDVHLFDYGYVDSFGAVELIAFVEKTFSIKIRQSDLVAYPLNTIREIGEFAVQRKRGEL
jgi:acyl carrier protein